MLYNRCRGIYKFGNNTYPRRIRCRLNLGHIFREKKVRLMGREIWYYARYLLKSHQVLLIYIQQFMKYLVYPWRVFVSLVHN